MMHSRIPTICAVLATTITAAAAGPPAAVPGQVLPKGTLIRLQLKTDLHSGQEKVGDPVAFTVTQPVNGPNGSLLVARGAAATGHVTVAFPHGDFGKRGRITFTCDTVRATDGTRVPVSLTVTAPAESDTAADDEFSLTYDAFGEPVSPDSFTPPAPADQSGYVPSGLPGGYYVAPSSWGSRVIYNPGRFFGGQDAVVKHGQKYAAKVSADTPVKAAAY